MKPGIYHDMPLEEYLADSATCATDLEALRRCPLRYQQRKCGLIPDEQTPAMLFGKLLHAWVLEHKTPWIVKPTTYEGPGGELKKWSGNAKCCQEWELDHVNDTVIDRATDTELMRCSDAVTSDPLAMSLLNHGDPEVSMFATDESGLALKARPDWMGGDYFVNIKVTRDARPDEFARTIYNRRYHVQAALAFKLAELHGLKITRYFFIAVERGPVPMTFTCELGLDDIVVGMHELEADLAKIIECQRSASWPGYSGTGDSIPVIHLPPWAYTSDKISLTIGGKTCEV